MPRYALLVEYDGTPFVGWQRQANGLSVQQVLERAATPLSGATPPAILAAGRTDSGVHAAGQVVQLDIERSIPPERLREALNFYMRDFPVVVLGATLAPEGWHARFSANYRSYRYRILSRRPRPALALGRVWHIPHPLDAEVMHRAAQTLLGHHDFTAFRATACQAKSPIRTLDILDVRRDGDEVVIEAAARSFLHHQVRNLAGTLAQVGMGRQPEEWPAAVLASKDRTQAGPTAPAEGLCFLSAGYPMALDWQ